MRVRAKRERCTGCETPVDQTPGVGMVMRVDFKRHAGLRRELDEPSYFVVGRARVVTAVTHAEGMTQNIDLWVSQDGRGQLKFEIDRFSRIDFAEAAND